MTRFLALAALIGIGCNGDDKGGGDTGDEGTEGGEEGGEDGASFEDFIYVTEAPVGDFTGFETGYTDAWLTQTPDPSCQQTVPMTGDVSDFESGDEVPEATLELYYANTVGSSPDQELTSSADGLVSGEIPTCTPYAYRVYTDPALGDTKVTIEVSQIDDFGATVDTEFNSVSSSTYQVIPSLLGVQPEPDKGIVAGTAYDMLGNAIEGAQVVVRDADGNIPDSLVVKYFRDEFPNRDQEWTSADGLWVAINVPVGDWNVEMYVSDGAGGHILMGNTVLSVQADSINISSIYTGFGDGVRYPESCLSACGT